MADSSDTDLSSSPESYQSCPDDENLGGWKWKADSSLTTSGDYNTAVEDVDPQYDSSGSRTTQRTTQMTTQMTAMQIDVGNAERDWGFSRTTQIMSRFLNEVGDIGSNSFTDEGIAAAGGGGGGIFEELTGGTLCDVSEGLVATCAGDARGVGEKLTGRSAGGARDVGDGLAAKSTVVESGLKDPKNKEKEKLLSGASKKVCEMSDKLKYFLKETAARGKTLQQKLDKVESNKAEVEKALSDHVKYLHSLLDYHHSDQQERLRQRHKEFLKQLMVNKTEELNFEARLKDVQRKVEDAVDRIVTHRDVSAASNHNMAALCDEYHRRVSSRPGKKEHSLTYMVEIPQVTADDMQALQGHYLFTGEDSKPPPPFPAPRWPGYEDAPGAGCGASSTADHHPAGSSKASTCSSSSSSSHRTSFTTGRSAEHQPPSGGPHPAKPPPPKAGSSQEARTSGNPPTSSLRFSKEKRAKEPAKLSSSTTLGAGASSSEPPHSLHASVDPRDVSARLDSKQKLSETMASSSSVASTEFMNSSKARKRVRSRRRQKEKKAESKKEAAEPPRPVTITLQSQRAQPKKFDGRLKEARGFAARPNGELWVVYGDRDPHLDRISEDGDILESYRIGGNTMHAASFSHDNVLLSLHSPCCQLKLLDEQKETRETIKLPLTPTGLGVGNTGIAVSSYKALYWIPLDGGRNEWIVQEKGSTLKHACSCEVIILRGREIVCVADRDGHKVWFFEKLDSGEFTPLPLFTHASHNHQGQTVPFSPVCLSSLPASSFLAVLDAASCSVLMVDVEKNEAVSVIAGKQLCQGIPSLITFALTDPGEDPKLWVASDANFIYLVSLVFLY